LAGLYHHTVKTEQTKEGNSTVDIGFHYVALNGSNQPNDYDSDGILDHLEDKDGDGVFDAGETDWQTSNSSVLRGGCVAGIHPPKVALQLTAEQSAKTKQNRL
jgi:hypothetical protein